MWDETLALWSQGWPTLEEAWDVYLGTTLAALWCAFGARWLHRAGYPFKVRTWGWSSLWVRLVALVSLTTAVCQPGLLATGNFLWVFAWRVVVGYFLLLAVLVRFDASHRSGKAGEWSD